MIAAKDIDRWLTRKDVFLIDLRTSEEFLVKHIKGAVNISYEKLKNCHVLPRDMTIILYCERGSVSMVAAKELTEKGYKIKTVIGGIHAYRGKYLESFR